MFLRVFLGIFEKTKEKKDRVRVVNHYGNGNFATAIVNHHCDSNADAFSPGEEWQRIDKASKALRR